MIIQAICGLPQYLVMGGAALLGAALYSGYSIYEKKKELGDEFELDYTKLADTLWQSVSAGLLAASTLHCEWTTLLLVMATGIGVDKLANKFNIKKEKVLNLVQFLGKLMGKK